MATKKAIYFIAGVTADATELADIAKLNAAANPAYTVAVRSKLASANFGAGKEAADYVAVKAGGSIPDDYSAVTVIDPSNPPAQSLPATQAIVSHNVDMVLPVTGVYATKIKATVVAGAITGFVLS